jgi:tetratricopeptide (TPR) repeat protein
MLVQLAEVRLRLNDWVGAEQAADALRALDGGQTLADQIDAASLTGQGRIAEGTSVLEGLASQPGGADSAMASLVVNYLRAGERDRAIAFLEGVLEENPDNTRALLLRAELDIQAGDPDAALDRLDRIVAAAPDQLVGHLARARLMLALQRVDDALAAAEEGVDQVENAEPLQLIRAQILETQNRFDDAIAIYEDLYRRNPSSALYANNLVSLVAEYRSDDPESLQFAKRVAQRLRGYEVPHLQDTYGWVMFLNGDYGVALRSLEAAAEGLPDNPLVRYHLGRAYAALDQVEEARAHLEASLELNPNFPKAASAREALAALPAAPAQ